MLTRVPLLNVGVLAMSVSMPFDCCLQSNVTFRGNGIKEVPVLTWISLQLITIHSTFTYGTVRCLHGSFGLAELLQLIV